LTFVFRCSAVRCLCLCVACAVSSPHLPIHKRSPKRLKESKGRHIHIRHPAIPTEKHKEEQDKRLPKHERATKRAERGRRESNHPEAESQGCVVSHCGVVSIVAFGLGVMHRVRFICSSDSIETDVIAIAIAVRQVVTRVQDWGIRGSRVCRRFSVGVGGFG
jgi:hypothetical protein